jgi:hypothetical protein
VTHSAPHLIAQQAAPGVLEEAPLHGPLAFKPGVAGVVGVVLVPVVVPDVAVEAAPEGPPALTPVDPLLFAGGLPAPALAPAAKAQLEDMASAAARVIVVTFMTSGSLV